MRTSLINNTQQYGLISKTLHWSIAILFISLFISGWSMVELTYYEPLYHQLPWWHKSIGVLTAFLILLQLLWLLITPHPLPLSTHQPWETKLANFAHKALLVLPLLICITGYLVISSDDTGADFFGWFQLPALQLPALISINPENDWLGKSHEYLAYLSLAIVLLHMVGAIKHHLIDNDNTLRRML